MKSWGGRGAQSLVGTTLRSPHGVALGFRAPESGHTNRTLGFTCIALSVASRWGKLESACACVYRGAYGLARGVTFGVGATACGRVVSLRHPTSVRNPVKIQVAGTPALAVTIESSFSTIMLNGRLRSPCIPHTDAVVCVDVRQNDSSGRARDDHGPRGCS